MILLVLLETKGFGCPTSNSNNSLRQNANVGIVANVECPQNDDEGGRKNGKGVADEVAAAVVASTTVILVPINCRVKNLANLNQQPRSSSNAI